MNHIFFQQAELYYWQASSQDLASPVHEHIRHQCCIRVVSYYEFFGHYWFTFYLMSCWGRHVFLSGFEFDELVHFQFLGQVVKYMRNTMA